ncbi:universal stress protein [Tautonia plasticadhaerens]|uniref:Universal stress protein n=1 Tax=Tautonia plasticadhaerens TaxID=2527974 RepID=A0A518GXS2_9BACT|nr:universal stress protein [Tautonia plasticadhaerens]QDV33396.1 Universal stress protein G [Tautonia plasticadhaerens]
MLQIDRILAPTDFSKHSEAAVRTACELADRLGAELHLVHVLSDVVVPAGPDPMLISSMPPEYYREVEAQARRTLETLCPADWPRPRRVVAEARWGDAVDEIHAYAAEQAVDLIVIATHGRTGLAHVLLGSVAERIVREAPCPVLTIRDKKAR